MSPVVSVIVLNWNGEKYLRSCLDSLFAQDYENLEVLVVDNGSTDGSLDLVKGYPSVTLIETGENLGFAAGNNVGIRRSRGEYVVIVNNDAELEKTCITEMTRALGKDKRYGACASKIFLKFEEDLLDAAGIVVCPDGLSIGRGRLERAERYDREEEVFFASGCCMMCRRTMLEDVKVGSDYFDEDFFMYADDTDLGWRARLRGWRAIYAPEAKAYHLHSASSETYSSLKAFLVERNRIWVQVKYFPLGLLLYGQLFTALRYLLQAYGAFAGKGASGAFSKSRSRLELVNILCRAWASALKGLPIVWQKRRALRQRSILKPEEIRAVARRFGIGARGIAFLR